MKKSKKIMLVIAIFALVSMVIPISHVYAESAAPGVAYNYTKSFLEKVAAGTHDYVYGSYDCSGYLNMAIADSGITMPSVGGIPANGGTIGYTGNWAQYITNIANGPKTITIGNTVFTAYICNTDVECMKNKLRNPGTIGIVIASYTGTSTSHAYISLGEFPSSYSTTQVANSLKSLYNLSNNLTDTNKQGRNKVWDKTSNNLTYMGNIWRVGAASADDGLYVDNAYGAKAGANIVGMYALVPSVPKTCPANTYKTEAEAKTAGSQNCTYGYTTVEEDGCFKYVCKEKTCPPESYKTEAEAIAAAKTACENEEYSVTKNDDDCYEYACKPKTCPPNTYETEIEAKTAGSKNCTYGYTTSVDDDDCYEYKCKSKTCPPDSYTTKSSAEAAGKKACPNGYTISVNNDECYLYTCKPSSSSNVPINPKTGTVAIIIAWIAGFAAIGYSVWYFVKTSKAKNK